MSKKHKEPGQVAFESSVGGAQHCCPPTTTDSPPKKAPSTRGASVSGLHGRLGSFLLFLCVLCCLALLIFAEHPRAASAAQQEGVQKSSPSGQSQEEANRKSSGCISCHTSNDEPTMHPTKTVALGCTDCHDGNASVSVVPGMAANSGEYKAAKERAHVQPRDASFKNRSNLPERTYTKWLAESAEYIKFVNPGDLRVAPETCGT